MTVFTFSFSLISTDTLVISLPVPEVVGIKIFGRPLFFARSRPHISRTAMSLVAFSETAFATSRELPPPTPMTRSHFSDLIFSTASSTQETGGSGLT